MAEEKSWQARISEATDKLAQSFVESISYDQRLYRRSLRAAEVMLDLNGDGHCDIKRQLNSVELTRR